MSGAIIAGLVVTCLLIGLLFAITVQFSKTLRQMAKHADSIHIRSQLHIDKLLDRIMAMDFATLKTWELAQESDAGGFEGPDAPTEEIGGVEQPGLWGRLTTLPERIDELGAQEQALLDEDFPEGEVNEDR